MCVSWPQACMTPSFWLAKGRPVSSLTGRASMSARMATHLPGLAPLMMATAPVGSGRSTLSQPKLLRNSTIFSVVRNSLLLSSGWAWKSRLQESISSDIS